MYSEQLFDWVKANKVADDLLWKSAAEHQISFIADDLMYQVGRGMDMEERREGMRVISTHRSKSVLLPVYELRNIKEGVTFILRYNFHNWKLSVISEREINADFSRLFHTTPPIEPDYTGDELHPVYFEGFPSNLIFGYYEPSDKKKWSAEIHGEHALWTVIFMCMTALGAVKPITWHTKESHRKELDAQSAEWKKRLEKEKKLEEERRNAKQ